MENKLLNKFLGKKAKIIKGGMRGEVVKVTGEGEGIYEGKIQFFKIDSNGEPLAGQDFYADGLQDFELV